MAAVWESKVIMAILEPLNQQRPDGEIVNRIIIKKEGRKEGRKGREGRKGWNGRKGGNRNDEENRK